jgi:hypothetical protein
VDDVREIDDRNWFADVTTFARRLEPQIQMIGRRYLQRRGDLGGIAERKLPSSLGVHHRVIARPAIVRVDVPNMRRGGFEHLPRRGAGLAHRLIELAHASRAVGVLIAVFWVALGLNDPDARPVSLELVGENHGQSGADSGAHFRAVGHDRNQSGLVDGEIDVGLEGRRGRGLGERENPWSDVEAQHQAGQAGDALDDRASAQVHDRGH